MSEVFLCYRGLPLEDKNQSFTERHWHRPEAVLSEDSCLNHILIPPDFAESQAIQHLVGQLLLEWVPQNETRSQVGRGFEVYIPRSKRSQGLTPAQTADWRTHHECKSLSKQTVDICTVWESYPLIDFFCLYEFPTDIKTIPVIHLLDAVYEHIKALPNRQTNHLQEPSLLYWNQHIAGLVISGQNYNRWAGRGSLFSKSVPTRHP